VIEKAEGDKAEYIEQIVIQLHKMNNPQLAITLAALRRIVGGKSGTFHLEREILHRDLQSGLQTE